VHLTGEVPTEERRAALSEVAAEVLPGTDVCNEVTVVDALAAPPLHEKIA
jgi:hypothetical protein